jgi:hypothetical protein
MFTSNGLASLFAVVPLVAAVALVATGCGTVSSSSGATAPATSASATSTPASSSATTPAPAAPPPPAAGTPVPAGPATADCKGWPSNVPYETLPASFTPVAAIRCVSNYQTLPGKGEWLVATLQRADKGLTQLTNALRQPAGHLQPRTICPEYVMLPPRIVLVDAAGKMVRPRLPVNSCGNTSGQVMAALAALPWQTVSVRPIAPGNGSA